MGIPPADEKLAMIRLAEPTPEELAAVDALRPGDYEIGFQRTNDILDEALEVFQRSSRSSMGVAGDEMLALFSAAGDPAKAGAGACRSRRPPRSSRGVAGDVMLALFSADGDLVNAAAGTYLHAIIQPIIIKYILE